MRVSISFGSSGCLPAVIAAKQYSNFLYYSELVSVSPKRVSRPKI